MLASNCLGTNVLFSIGNTTIMKYGRKRWIHRRTEMYCFPMGIQQLWNIDENDESIDAPKSVLSHLKYNNYEKRNEIHESIDAPKFEYFHGNMKDYENQSDQEKIRHSTNAYNYVCFWRRIDVDATRQKLGTPKMPIITVAFERCWW